MTPDEYYEFLLLYSIDSALYDYDATVLNSFYNVSTCNPIQINSSFWEDTEREYRESARWDEPIPLTNLHDRLCAVESHVMLFYRLCKNVL